MIYIKHYPLFNWLEVITYKFADLQDIKLKTG